MKQSARESAIELRSRLRSLERDRDDLEEEIMDLEEKLYEAEHVCPNCGGQTKVIGEPCSRVCGLQLEWAAELKTRQGSAA